MVKDRHFDVIFMDIKLPGRDGLTIFQEIKTIDPDARVIFITGFVLEDSIKRALEAGAYSVAYKPLDLENILALVQQTISEQAP